MSEVISIGEVPQLHETAEIIDLWRAGRLRPATAHAMLCAIQGAPPVSVPVATQPSTTTVREAVREYLREIDRRVDREDPDAPSKGHAQNIRTHLRALADALGDTVLAKVTEEQCREALFTRQRSHRRGEAVAASPLSTVTRGKYLDSWQAFFRWCVDRDYIAADAVPVAGIECSTNSTPKTEPLTAERWTAILAAMPLDGLEDWRPFYIQFAYETGADPGECETERVVPERHVVWSAKEDGGAWVCIPGTKERCRDRWVPLRPWYAAQLRAYADSRNPSRPLFPPWHAGQRAKYMRAACEAARVGVRFASKDMRAGFNDRLREAAVSTEFRDQLLGHAVAGINAHYSRQMPASKGGPKPIHLRPAVEALPVYALPIGWPLPTACVSLPSSGPPAFLRPQNDETPGNSEGFEVERDTGFEPATFSLGSRRTGVSHAQAARANGLIRQTLSTVSDPARALSIIAEIVADTVGYVEPVRDAVSFGARPLAFRRAARRHGQRKLTPDGDDSDDEPPIVRVLSPTPRGLGRAG